MCDTITFGMQVNCSTSNGEHFNVAYARDGGLRDGFVCGKSISLPSNVACHSGVTQPVIKSNRIILGRNNMTIILVIVAINGFYISVESDQLPMEGIVRRQSVVVGVVRLPARPFVRARTTAVVLSLAIVCLVLVVIWAFVRIVSEPTTVATFVFAEVSALVCKVTILTAMSAFALLL